MKPLVGVLMGSKSDWPGVMEHCSATLDKLGIEHEARALSAHRTPDAVHDYCTKARDRGIKAIIAAAGGAAHLAGVAAAYTTLPVLAVPIESKLLGLDSLLAMVQMPGGIPVATFAVGKPGAVNAALFAASILSTEDADMKKKLDAFRQEQREKVLAASELHG